MWVYVYLGITALAVMVEFITNDLTSIWFAGGGLVAMILSALGLEWYFHLVAFIVVSLALLLSLRRILKRFFIKNEVKTNAQSVIGKEFTLLEDISFNTAGSIKVNDVIWTAVGENNKLEIKKGQIVRIIDIKGNKYIVEEVK